MNKQNNLNAFTPIYKGMSSSCRIVLINKNYFDQRIKKQTNVENQENTKFGEKKLKC